LAHWSPAMHWNLIKLAHRLCVRLAPVGTLPSPSVSFLRAKGIPSGLLCGFASYLGAGCEDHWICQYWDAEKASWLLTDPQLDDVLRADCGVTFSTSEMPRDVF
jgi:hypothetical protein